MNAFVLEDFPLHSSGTCWQLTTLQAEGQRGQLSLTPLFSET